MGIRYRKSINLGGGFRVNVSKSGVGYSWGVKGARITKTARGTTRRTLSIPGTGISYVDESAKKNKCKNKDLSNENRYKYEQQIIPSQSTETVNLLDYQPVEYKELLDSIKKVQNINLLSTILIWTFLLSAIPIFLLTGIVGIALKIYTHTKLSVLMDYEFDEESSESYDNLCSIWMSMNQNNKFWQTISESMINKKTSGGASRGVTRIPTRAINKVPYFVKTNVKPFGLQLRKQKLYFFPDKLLVVSGKRVGAINYSDMSIELGTTNFVETDPVPKDAKVIRQTWLKVNKNGSQDKRFRGNRQVPVCEYGAVVIKSRNDLHVELMCSNSSTVETMKDYAKKVFK